MKKIEGLGFKQQIKEPTHVEGGQIDHVYLYVPHEVYGGPLETLQFGQYFSDHDHIQICISEVDIKIKHILLKFFYFRKNF